jgi:hypothetical protein
MLLQIQAPADIDMAIIELADSLLCVPTLKVHGQRCHIVSCMLLQVQAPADIDMAIIELAGNDMGSWALGITDPMRT